MSLEFPGYSGDLSVIDATQIGGRRSALEGHVGRIAVGTRVTVRPLHKTGRALRDR